MADYISRYTGEEVDERLGLAETALQEQVQADWEQTDDTAADYIKNKPTIPDEFIAMYGVTTYAEIAAAVRDDKTITLNRDDLIYAYCGQDTLHRYRFVALLPSITSIENISAQFCLVSSTDEWTNTYAVILTRSDIVTSMDAQSTNTQIPSAKCVYDAIQAAGGGGGLHIISNNGSPFHSEQDLLAYQGPVKEGDIAWVCGGAGDGYDYLALYIYDVDAWSQFFEYDLPVEAVMYDFAQSLNSTQKARARTNIGAGTYSKPSGGIPKTDLASAVQTSLGLADSAYQKPSGGIPASDIASGVIPSEIDTVSVTVDNNTGTPSATASVSGSTLSLAFSNLKGATGATGPQGPVGPQGVQGNTGASVAYPYELVNNLTTDDATKGLSAAQGVALKSEVSQLDIEINGGEAETKTPVPISGQSYSDYSVSISAQNKWQYSASYKCAFIPVNPGETYKFIIGSVPGVFAFLQDMSHTTGETPNFSAEYQGRILGDNMPSQVVIPSDCHYIYAIQQTSGGTVNTQIFKVETEIVPGLKDAGEKNTADIAEIKAHINDNPVDLQQIFDNIPIAVDSNGWEIPTTAGMVNALKKAAQACNIVYNAKSTYPTNSSDTGGAAGEHTGFPYSSTKQIRKYIGWEVSQRTFMTAVNNPYSLFYTENISAARSKSGYGFTYSGENCGSYYGMVCSIFAEWALGFKIPYETFNFAYLARIGKLVKVAEQSAQGVHICDLLWQSGHTMLVTGVQRDQYGNVINVITSESKSNVKATTRTAANFNSYLSTNNCIFYRPTEIYKNTEYVPSEFVAVRGESTPLAYVYNDDICFFAGDYAAWRASDDCWLNYEKVSTKPAWTATEVDLSGLTPGSKTIDATNHWLSPASSPSRSVEYPMTPGTRYRVVGPSGNKQTVIAVLSTADERTGDAVFATGFNSRYLLQPGEVYEFVAPEDAGNLYMLKVDSSSTNVLPSLYTLTQSGTQEITFTAVKLYKGDTLIQTVSLDADATVHKLDVTSYMDGAGKYKACLTDGTTDSDYTYWELVDTSVSYADGRVSFASTNGTPWWAQICSATGATFCFYEITDEDVANGYADVDFAQLIEDQEGDATGTTYLRVMFKSDYGGVVSVMQQVTLSNP